VRGDAVCYYYPSTRPGGENQRTEFCWHLERVGSDGYKVTLVGRSAGGIARLEPGSRGHTDNGRAWVCDALISRRGTGHAEARLNAAPSP